MAPPIGGSIETRFHQVGGATKKSIKVGGGWWSLGEDWCRFVESRYDIGGV